MAETNLICCSTSVRNGVVVFHCGAHIGIAENAVTVHSGPSTSVMLLTTAGGILDVVCDRI
jgi:hypothetical protein